LAYIDRVYPGVYVGDYNVGGFKVQDVKNLVENFNNRLSRDGLEFTALDAKNQPVNFKINSISAGDPAVEIIRLDSDAVSAEAVKMGRTGSLLRQFWEPIKIYFFPGPHLKARL